MYFNDPVFSLCLGVDCNFLIVASCHSTRTPQTVYYRLQARTASLESVVRKKKKNDHLESCVRQKPQSVGLSKASQAAVP